MFFIKEKKNKEKMNNDDAQGSVVFMHVNDIQNYSIAQKDTKKITQISYVMKPKASHYCAIKYVF